MAPLERYVVPEGCKKYCILLLDICRSSCASFIMTVGVDDAFSSRYRKTLNSRGDNDNILTPSIILLSSKAFLAHWYS